MTLNVPPQMNKIDVDKTTGCEETKLRETGLSLHNHTRRVGKPLIKGLVL